MAPRDAMRQWKWKAPQTRNFLTSPRAAILRRTSLNFPLDFLKPSDGQTIGKQSTSITKVVTSQCRNLHGSVTPTIGRAPSSPWGNIRTILCPITPLCRRYLRRALRNAAMRRRSWDNSGRSCLQLHARRDRTWPHSCFTCELMHF